MSLAKNLAAMKKTRRMTTARLSELSGVPKGTINKLLTGETANPTLSTLSHLADALDCTPAQLAGTAAASEGRGRPIPMLGEIAAGIPIFAVQESEEVYCDGDLRCDFALRVKGDSMIGARILDGDIVFIRAQEDVENGEIAAVIVDDSATLKHVYHIPDGLQLVSDNPRFPPMVFTGGNADSIRILGKAVAFRSRL